MKNKININISGICDSGKTTIAYEIYKHLLSLGFDIDFGEDDTRYEFIVANQEKRIEAIKGLTEIKISQTKVHRESIK